MVSHSQVLDRVLPHRGPPSASSRSATSRRHRSSRSHSGGTSYRPQNEYPNFSQTGDVEIIIIADGQEKRYLLHRLILVQNSGFFEASTSEDWSRAQTTPSSGARQGSHLGSISEEGARVGNISRNPGQQRWRYELDWGSKDDEVPMLVQRVSIRCG